jgi:hypothetical protein
MHHHGTDEQHLEYSKYREEQTAMRIYGDAIHLAERPG